MKYFYPTLYTKHNPKYDYSDGLPPFRHVESIKRYEKILQGVINYAKKEDIVSSDRLIGLKYLYEIHDKKYIKFLFDLCNNLDEKEDFLPSMFRDDLSNAPLRFKSGMYCKEIGTPIQKHSIKAILNSAYIALISAKYVHKNRKNAFALTRPPSHHSGVKSYGGYCYVNNCFIGANYFLKLGLKPVILDIDYHIGDGTIELCEKFGVDYFSLHVNPWRNYPYLSKDTNFKQNIYLNEIKKGTTCKEYLKKLQNSLDTINRLKPDVFILSLGLDTLKNDKGQDEEINLKKSDFYSLGKCIKTSITCNILIYLEGGYNRASLTKAMEYFLKGINGE